MILEQLGPAACRSYLVACERTRQAILVDPLPEGVDTTLEDLDRRHLRLDLVIDTHCHADHVSGGPAFARTAGVPYALHEATECSFVTERVRDGQVLEVGDVRVEVMHTPGHTPDSVSLKAGRDLMTGDFLFLAQDGAGRLDLPGGDAGVHWESLRRLCDLGDETVARPGHDYQELTDSTLGVERVRNPRFQNVSREEYVAWQKAVAMDTPTWMLEVIAANLGNGPAHGAHHEGAGVVDAPAGLSDIPACPPGGGACSSGAMARVPMVSPQEAHRRRTQSADPPFLLDVREPWEFAAPMGRHAPGAVLVPLGQLPRRLDDLPGDREAEMLVICKSGGRSAHAAEFLIANGWRRIFNVATGTDGWVRAGLPIDD